MIYVIMQHTGQYSDYRARPLFYTTDEDSAKLFCEKAQEMARILDEKRQKIDDNIGYETEGSYEKAELKMSKLKSPFDPYLSKYEFGDVHYDYTALEKWNMQ